MRLFNRKRAKIFVLLAWGWFSWPGGALSIQGPVTAAAQDYHIRQHRARQGGVLTSQPDPQDVEIMRFIDTLRIQTLEDYSAWLAQAVHYQPDTPQDHWAGPAETLRRQGGDCEDLALLNSAVLQVLGFQPRFLALFGKSRAHAICAFQQNGFYFWFDNVNLMRSPARSWPELVRQLRRHYRFSRLREFDLAKRRWQAVQVPS